MANISILPGRLREKNGYYHLVIDAKNPLNNTQIRHSKSTGLKVTEKTKTASKENYNKALCMLQEFREKWTDIHLKGVDDQGDFKNLYFTDYLQSWFQSLKPSLQKNTINSYSKIILRKIIPYFEPKKLSLGEIKAKDIQDYYTYCLNKENLSGNTVCKHHAIIRKCLQTALKQEMVIKNVADLVDRPKIQKYIAKTMSEEEIKMFFDAIKNPNFYVPAFLSLNLGLRRSEVLGLLWSNIDFEQKTVLIGNTVIEVKNGKSVNRKSTKTKKSYRTLPLPLHIEQFLLALKEKQEENKKLFGNCYIKDYADNVCVTEQGDLIKPQFLTQHFKNVIRDLNLDDRLTFHSLRHTFATRVYNNGGDFKMLQVLMGHSCISTTMDIYTHFPTTRMEEAKEIIDNLVITDEKNKK